MFSPLGRYHFSSSLFDDLNLQTCALTAILEAESCIARYFVLRMSGRVQLQIKKVYVIITTGCLTKIFILLLWINVIIFFFFTRQTLGHFVLENFKVQPAIIPWKVLLLAVPSNIQEIFSASSTIKQAEITKLNTTASDIVPIRCVQS